MPSASTASAPAEVIGSTLDTKYDYDAKGQGVLIREPKLELNNNNSGKAEDIYLFTGQRPQAAFGNSTGDRQMLEWATAGAGKRLGMLVLHDDKEREYAYGPAAGLPDTQGRHLHPGALRRGQEARLGRDQHEGRLEADLRVREVSPWRQPHAIGMLRGLTRDQGAQPDRGTRSCALRAGWAFVAMLPAILGGAHARADDTPATAPWQLSVTPYLWATALKGDVRVGRTKRQVDASFNDILDNLNGALMLSLELRKGRFGLLSDTVYADLEDNAATAEVGSRSTPPPRC